MCIAMSLCQCQNCFYLSQLFFFFLAAFCDWKDPSLKFASDFCFKVWGWLRIQRTGNSVWCWYLCAKTHSPSKNSFEYYKAIRALPQYERKNWYFLRKIPKNVLLISAESNSNKQQPIYRWVVRIWGRRQLSV